MKNFRWILLGGLLVTATQLAQAQPGRTDGRSSSSDPRASSSSDPRASSFGSSSTGGSDVGGISNGTATTTTTTTTGVSDSPDVVAVDSAAFGDPTTPTPNTGGEPLLVIMGGLSVAAMALVARRKVTA